MYDRYQNDDNVIISAEDRRIAIQKLKRGKSVGNDGIAAEALMYVGDLLFVHLTVMFNMCISHRYLTNSLMATTIIPVSFVDGVGIVTSTRQRFVSRTHRRTLVASSIFSIRVSAETREASLYCGVSETLSNVNDKR